MPYIKTVASAIGICFIASLLWPVGFLIYRVSRTNGIGFGVTLGGG
jgi:hypothetical protein